MMFYGHTEVIRFHLFTFIWICWNDEACVQTLMNYFYCRFQLLSCYPVSLSRQAKVNAFYPDIVKDK